MSELSKDIEEKLQKDIDITKESEGKNLKDLISATRKISREYRVKKEAIESETGFKILDSHSQYTKRNRNRNEHRK